MTHGPIGRKAARAPEDILATHATTYDYLRSRLDAIDWTVRPGLAVECAERIADLAAIAHPGRFADGGLENIALEIGRRLDDLMPRSAVPNEPSLSMPPANGTRSVLHVATATAGIGGMSRTILNWVKHDTESRHSLALTRQEYPERVRPWLRTAVESTGGRLLVFPPAADLLVKARWLRELAHTSADLIVLHQSWSDLLPTIAFATEAGPPVALVNQVDHLYWLGSTVVDAVINLRPVEEGFNEARRYTRRNLSLPIPLVESLASIGRADARARLGISSDRVMLVSVGREVKYLPDARQNFCSTACKLLDRNPGADLYIIGVPQSYATSALGDPRHPRLHFVGIVEDPSVYQAAADLYLESFPFGSQTALLEAGLAGTAPVRSYAPQSRLLVSQDEGIEGICPVASTEDEYIAQITELINDPAERQRRGEMVSDRIRSLHAGTGWDSYLTGLYRALNGVRHQPTPLPRTECMGTADDLVISGWHDSFKHHMGREVEPKDANQAPGSSVGAPAADALRVLIRHLRDRSQRSSRRASVEAYQHVLTWIDQDVAPRDANQHRQLRGALLEAVAERLSWMKWERDWANYWPLRRFIDREWKSEPRPSIATEWIAPPLVYRLKDMWDGFARRGVGDASPVDRGRQVGDVSGAIVRSA